jgi:hypothetical protein
MRVLTAWLALATPNLTSLNRGPSNLSVAVTVFDCDGHVVKGSLRRKALKLHAKKWPKAMYHKPIRGAILWDVHEDMPVVRRVDIGEMVRRAEEEWIFY